MITDDDIKFILETAHLSPVSSRSALRELIKPVA
jgi:hypothetical protein